MNKALQLAVILSAYDRMTRVVNDTIGRAEQRIKGLKRVSDSAFAFGRDAAAIGLALAAPITLATREAIKFEDKMADVAKVMDLTVGSEEFNKMANDVKSISQTLGLMPDQAAALTASLAQGGVAKEDLAEITKFAGQVSVAFDVMAETAGDAFVKTRNALGVTNEQTKAIFDAINKLSDSDAAKASQIVEFMAAGGASVARSMNISGQAAAAFGTSLIAVGKSGSEAATIMDRFKKGILTNEEMKAIYDAAGGGLAGIVRVLDVGANSKDPFAFFNKFGQYGSDIMLMAQNLDHVATNLNLVGNSQNYANSVLLEFENRNSTTQGKLNRMRAEMAALAVDIGNSMLPVIVQLQKSISPILAQISAWIQRNPELTATIVKITAGIAAFALAVSGISFAVGAVSKTISFGISIFNNAAKAIQFVGASFRFVASLFMTNPILLAVAAIIAAVYLLITNWDAVAQFFVDLWNRVKAIFQAVWPWLKMTPPFFAVGLIIDNWDSIVQFFVNLWERVKVIFNGIWSWLRSTPIVSVVAFIIDNWDLIVSYFADLWDRVKSVFTEKLKMFVQFHKALYQAGVNIVKSIWDGIKSMASKPVEAIADIVKKIREYLPFSPAKRGPLMDIHRIRLIETISDAIKPTPLINAVDRVVRAAVNITPRFAPVAGVAIPPGGGGMVTVNFSPTINISGDGGDLRSQVLNALREYEGELLRMIQNAKVRQERKRY